MTRNQENPNHSDSKSIAVENPNIQRIIDRFKVERANAAKKGLVLLPSVDGPYVFDPVINRDVGRYKSEEYRLAVSNEPQSMTKERFLELQFAGESLDLDHAQGHELPGHYERVRQISELMDASPWTLHPDYGCVLKSQIEVQRERQGEKGREMTNYIEKEAEVTDPDQAIRAHKVGVLEPLKPAYDLPDGTLVWVDGYDIAACHNAEDAVRIANAIRKNSEACAQIWVTKGPEFETVYESPVTDGKSSEQRLEELKALGFDSEAEYQDHQRWMQSYKEATAKLKADSIAAGSTAFDRKMSDYIEKPAESQDNAHAPIMKSITLVLDASGALDLDEAPTYAALDIDQVFISRIEKLLAVCQASELTEARISYCPNWGPAGIEEDLRLQSGELVVFQNDAQGASFWFTDNPRDSGGSIQTNSVSLERLKQAFASAENGAVVFLTQGMGARDDYEEDHSTEEALQRCDRPSP